MSESSVGEIQNEPELDERSISELVRFFLLLDKWDREASEDPKAMPSELTDQRRDFDTL